MLKEIIISLPLILSPSLITQGTTDTPSIITHNGTKIVADESHDNITTVIATVTKHDKEYNGLYATNNFDPSDDKIYIPESLKEDFTPGDQIKVTFQDDDAIKVVKY